MTIYNKHYKRGNEHDELLCLLFQLNIGKNNIFARQK